MRASPDSLPALIRPPLQGWVIFAFGVAAGVWGAITIGTISYELGARKSRVEKAFADSILATMQTGVIIHWAGQPLWIAPPRDTTKH